MTAIDSVGIGAELRYGVDGARLSPRVAACVRELSPDGATFDFLERQVSQHQGRLKWAAHAVLRGWCSDFTVNGLLGTYRLHLLSALQWQSLLGAGNGHLLDVGAGVGDVTAELMRAFDDVLAVETVASLVHRLKSAGIPAVRADLTHMAVPGAPYDAISLLNVLDRCGRPRTLLAKLVAALRPHGQLIVSMPLPYDPIHCNGRRTHEPSERLPLGRGPWEEQVELLVARVLEPAGLELESVSRAPYLSEGDRSMAFYELDAAIVICRRAA